MAFSINYRDLNWTYDISYEHTKFKKYKIISKCYLNIYNSEGNKIISFYCPNNVNNKDIHRNIDDYLIRKRKDKLEKIGINNK